MPEEIGTRQRIARLTPLDDVLARIRARVNPVAPRRTSNLAAALNHTLAGDITVEQPIPKAALALRDGWAEEWLALHHDGD